jgi:hypothetical protein
VNPNYYGYSSWQSGWPSVGGYAYPGNYQAPQQGSFVQYQPQNDVPQAKIPTKAKSPTPSPSPPPPESYRHWDEVIVSFLTKLGLTQAAAGFEADILVMNPEWEQNKVPAALKELCMNISVGFASSSKDMHLNTSALDSRKSY